MRIVKLSAADPDMATRQAVDAFFREELPRRDPAGKFRFPAGRLGQNGLRRGERLLFTYKGECVYQGRAASGREDNQDEDWIDYPFYFCVDMASGVKAEGRLSELEWELDQQGLLSKNLVQSQGWPSLPEDDRWAEVSRILDRVLGPVPGDPLADDSPTEEPTRPVAAPDDAAPTGARQVVRMAQDRPSPPVAPSPAAARGVAETHEESLGTEQKKESGCIGLPLFLMGVAMGLSFIFNRPLA